MKKLDDSQSHLVNGTSFYDVTIRTSINQLTKVLGEPSMNDNSGEDKVNVEWEVITNGSNYFPTVGTIYDWKEYKRLEGDDVVEFHIGGHSKLDTTIIFRELSNLLK